MFILVLILFLLFPKHIFATNDFNLIQNIQYRIDISGNAQVIQEVELSNNLSQVYPKEYQIRLSSKNIKNIVATDDLGSIVEKINQQDESTIIYLKFNQENVGKNQKTKFKLNYFIPNLAVQKGTTWEISLPENQNQVENYNFSTSIFLPKTFGSLSFASISPNNVLSLNNQTEIYFNSINNKNQKILLIFGDYQLFDFKFKYFLHNSSNKIDIFQITLPPETDNQKIIYRSINPPPQNIYIDDDGNYLANFQLAPNQTLNIDVDGQVKIIHSNINKTNIDQTKYLNSDLYWDTKDPKLISIAKQLSSPKEIYQYVINTLSYKFDQINSSTRQGALLAINNPSSALCTEFTDLFITLSRINGIPAREIQGFAYSNNIKIKPINTNTDILHAWPQYYDNQKQAWISIDPTWGKTTNGIDYFTDLDPNHFVFVFHGLSSTKPLPPGAYKNNQEVKTIQVEFAKNELKPDKVPLNISSVSKNFYLSPIIKIQNPNYNSISNLKISIKNSNFVKIIEHLPPLSSIEIPVENNSFFLNFLPKNYKLTVSLQYNSNITEIKINNPKYWLNLIILLATIITLIGFSGIIINRFKKK